jgi:hypothetical protein
MFWEVVVALVVVAVVVLLARPKKPATVSDKLWANAVREMKQAGRRREDR